MKNYSGALDKALCVALSGLFIDSQVDYKYIASVARNFPLELVEYVLYNYVAPACHYNTIGPLPPVIYFFDENDLMNKIKSIAYKRKSYPSKIIYTLFSFYLRIRFKHEWVTLKHHCMSYHT